METKSMAFSVKTITMCGLMAAVCCILGPLSIPVGSVPISLTVISVYICVYTLGMLKGTLSYIIYLCLGAIGLPVFSGFEGGVQKLIGPTGGYLVGFIFMALISGFFIDRFSNKKWYMHIIGMILGLAVCYLVGTFYFMFVMNMEFVPALFVCVIPFLPFDCIKIALCVSIGSAIKEALTAAHLRG